jgi:hypothetical protein
VHDPKGTVLSSAVFAPIFILFGLGIAAVSLGFWIWSIVDAARRPDEQWTAAGQSKALWLGIIIGTGVIGCLSFGWVGALLYLLIPRPALQRTPASPPAPGYYS